MSQATRDYKTFDYKYGLTLSASQLGTFAGEKWEKGKMKEGCQRKWMFQKVWRLPVEEKNYLTFGTVLHEACERWLEADDQGRNPDGTKLELWPDGWDATVSFSESALIRTLVEKAIEEGMLVRYPYRKVELPIQMPVLPDREATLIGFVDCDTPDMVIDQKTTSSFKWAKTSQGLAENTQLLTYAAHTVRRWMQKHGSLEGLEFVTLRHNVFLKNEEEPAIRPTEAQVAPERVIQFWDEVVVPSAKKMLELKKSGIPVEDWSKVEGATTKGTCRKYGGCPFAEICGGKETPTAHVARVNRLKANQPTATEKEDVSKLFDKLKAKKGISPAAKPAEEEPKASEETPDTSQADADAAAEASEAEHALDKRLEAMEEVLDHAPWANPDCRACGGRGLNKTGKPCRACVAAHKRSEGDEAFNPEDFELKAGKGIIKIVRAGRTISQIETTGEVEAKKQSAPKGVKKVEAPKEEAPKEEEKAEAPVEQPNPEQEAVKTKPKTKKTTSKLEAVAKMRMVYGSVRIQRGAIKVVDMSDVLKELGEELAEAMKRSNYYAIKAFERRDALAQKAEEIAKRYAGITITVQRGHPDVEALAAVLEPFAEEVIEGTR